MSTRAACLAAWTTLVFACTPAPHPRLTTGTPPPKLPSEAAVANADRAEAALREEGYVLADAALQSYLGDVAKRLLPHLDAAAVPLRVEIIADPYRNAFALPNGFIGVHTGLLAAMDNEAQLAMVLGHELEHYLGRHSLRIEQGKVDRERANTALTALSIALLPLPGVNLLMLGAAAAGAPDRDELLLELEMEADAASMRTLAAAGYDASQAPLLFEEIDKAARGRVRDPYLYGDSKVLKSRLDNSRRVLAKLPRVQASYRGSDEYESAISSALLVNAGLDLKIRRFDEASTAVARHLERNPNSAKGHLVRADLLARQAGTNAEKREAALREYSEAVALDPALAEAHREHGLYARSLGRDEEARRSLRRYLELSPKAADRAILESYLR